MVLVRLSNIEVDEEGLFKAGLEVNYGGRIYEFKVERLLRKPMRAKARIEGDYLMISIEDNEGKPLSSCCIHVKHLELGCIDCRNLMMPPSGF